MKPIKRKKILQRNKKIVLMCPIRLIEDPKTCDWDGYDCNEGCEYGTKRTRKDM